MAPGKLVIFGDSFTDGGNSGYGVAGCLLAPGTDYPTEVMVEPMERIKKDYGSVYPFSELGYHEGCWSDGPTWPHLLGHFGHEDLKILNFAHGGATTCQDVNVPPGYVAMASEVALGGHKRRSRGVAQQIRQASQILLKEDWQDSCTLVIVGPVINDFLFHGTVAIGSTAEEAITSPYVSNHRQILADLLDIGVDMDRIIFTGFPGIECAPFCENFDVDLEWFRRQQDVVNELIEALGPRRWRLELLVRRQFQIHGAHCLRYICEVLPSLNPEDLGKIEIRGAGCSEIAIWYDEIHPAAALHLDMAQDFANNFLVRPHSDSPVKTELLLHRQTTFAARRVRSINCSRVA